MSGFLTQGDMKIMPFGVRSNGNWHIWTQWYLRGWTPLPYQYKYHMANLPSVSWKAGVACVAADTLVYNPVTDKETPIADLNDWSDVLAWNGNEFIVTRASPSFVRGRTGLYKVVLETGEEITATLEHRFLTPDGFARLSDVHVGSLVGVPSILDRPTHEQCGVHCSRIVQDYRDHYFGGSRQYDEPPQWEEDSGLVSVPSHNGVRGFILSGLLVDDQELGSEYSHAYQLSDLRSSEGYQGHLEDRVSHAGCFYAQENCARPQGLSRQFSGQSGRNSDLTEQAQLRLDQYLRALMIGEIPGPSDQSAWRKRVLDDLGSHSLFQGTWRRQSSYQAAQMPPRFAHELFCQSFSYDTILSLDNDSTDVLFVKVEEISHVGDGEFYDLYVPGYNNYVANGIVNHNSGKTATNAASYLTDCLTTPWFKALSTSVTAKQAELQFDMFMGWYEGNDRLIHLVDDIKLRPWPVISFRNMSQWEFRTAGLDARFIRGSEYDRIGFDECGLDMDGVIPKVLRTRLRGTRPDGTKRLCRLDCFSSPTAALWWIERFRKGWKGSEIYDPRYFSMLTKTRENTNLTEEQIGAMEAELTDEEIAVEMDAEDPDYGMSLFPLGHLSQCTNMALYDRIVSATRSEDGKSKPGFTLEEHPRYGVMKYEVPSDPDGHYVLAGDPGQDAPPKRNSGVVGVVDNRNGELVYFHWIDGQGHYENWVLSMKYAIQKYNPMVRLLDTTGTQKGIQELGFERFGVDTDRFHFGQDKDAALNFLITDVAQHNIHWPTIKGLVKQMSTYTRQNDKDGAAQDIVMMLAMTSYGRRSINNIDTTEQTSSRVGSMRSKIARRRRRR